VLKASLKPNQPTVNYIIETEGVLRVTGGHEHCKTETVQNSK